jgi:thiol-disulfide isomerase/thioredoxin
MRWKWPLIGVAITLVLSLSARILVAPVSAPTAAPAADATTTGTIIAVSPPRPMPELHFADGDGHPLTLADFRGRAVLLNIWATWCVPCRKEMPSLDRLQARLGGRDLVVVPLSIDRKGADVVRPFYRKLGLASLGVYLDQSGNNASALNIEGLPTTLLIDREGREVGRAAGPAEWDAPAVISKIRLLLHLPGAGRQ